MNIQKSSLHPCIKHNNVYTQICRPLEKLGVKFFGYTAVDTDNRAYCLGSEVGYAERYLSNNHANKDVHFVQHEDTQKPSYFFWDYADLSEDEKAVYKLAHEHQQGHTLTITKQTKTMTHCYHFSSHINDDQSNQRFLNEMDYLHSFIDYFNDCLTNIPEISGVYEHPINVHHKNLDHDFIIVGNDPRTFNLEKAKSHLRFKNFATYYLTDKERTCLYWLQRGKSTSMIAQIEERSVKSIERHITSMKRKYECYTLYQLGQKIANKGLNELFEKQLFVQ